MSAMSDHEFYCLSGSENSHESDVAASSDGDVAGDCENVYEGVSALSREDFGSMAWADDAGGSPMDLDEAVESLDSILGDDLGATNLGFGNHGIGKSLICLNGMERELQVCDDDDDEVGGSSVRSLVSALFSPEVVTYGAPKEPLGSDHGPSCCSREMLKSMMGSIAENESIVVFNPKPDERVETPRDGCVCLYAPFFTECGLRFPIPRFVTEYCSRRAIALSQLSIAAIRNMVGLQILGAECGVEIDVRLLEAATVFSSAKDNPGLCKAHSVARHKICESARSKVADWR